jgi:hypothetical protein
LYAFVDEIVQTGIKSGLLTKGMTVYPAKTTLEVPEGLGKTSWDFVRGNLVCGA